MNITDLLISNSLICDLDLRSNVELNKFSFGFNQKFKAQPKVNLFFEVTPVNSRPVAPTAGKFNTEFFHMKNTMSLGVRYKT